MTQRIQTRGGAVLLQRLGTLRAQEQSRWDRAPASRGLWAFPWPLFEMFFAYHQYDHVAPVRLRRDPDGWPVHLSAFVDSAGTPPGPEVTRAEIVADLADYPSEWGIRDGWHTERDAWVRDVGERVLRRRRFFYDGDLYTHLTPRGDILGLGEWRRMSARAFAEAFVRSGGNTYVDVTDDGMWRGRTAADYFEVFLPHGAGQTRGRVADTPRRQGNHRPDRHTGRVPVTAH